MIQIIYIVITNDFKLHNDLSVHGPCSVRIGSYSFSLTNLSFEFIYCHFFISLNVHITKSLLLTMFHLSVFHVFPTFTFVWLVYTFCGGLCKIAFATSPKPALAYDIGVTALIYFLSRFVKTQNRKTFILYVDFKKPFDSIHRAKMPKILKAYRLPPNLLNAIALL